MLEIKSIKKVIILGSACVLLYAIVYFAKNLLSVATPDMIRAGYSTEHIGLLSTTFMLTYAIGQLVNGIMGDRVKSKYMICMGMAASAVGIGGFLMADNSFIRVVLYGISGFAMSMTYAPMVKVITDNSSIQQATNILLCLAVAANGAAPAAGLAAMILNWNALFTVGAVLLAAGTAVGFGVFTLFEKSGGITYKKSIARGERKETKAVYILIKNEIVRYTFVAVFTGIIRTSVVFWIPTFLVQYLGYSVKSASGIFSCITLVIAFSPYIGVCVYRYFFQKNINRTVFCSFIIGTAAFLLMCVINNPTINIVLLITALLSGNIASAMIWNVYCPSLSHTGLVSTATGYLNFISYLGGAAANFLFSNAISSIGWKQLLTVWGMLMLAGAILGRPWRIFSEADL